MADCAAHQQGDEQQAHADDRARKWPAKGANQQFAREWAEARVGAFDNSFAARYAEHFPELHRLFLLVYGERADGLEALAELVALALRSWNERPGDLKALDAGHHTVISTGTGSPSKDGIGSPSPL